MAVLEIMGRLLASQERMQAQTAADLKELREDLKDREPKADAHPERMEAFAEELRA
jgi:uncharacterized coiled-coil protein SlyX